MKLRTFILIAIAAYFTVVAFKAALQPAVPINSAAVILEKKKFSILCSPLYIPSASDDIPLLPGWGNYSWKITTASDSAQIYFNQGINMYFAFHIIEARASFDKATRFDPDCAMAWWGEALAFGPNINDFGYEQPSEAYPSAQRALALKATGAPIEQALIEAMNMRYSADSTVGQEQLNILYAHAMGRIFNQFPADANVSTLYADALMLLHPWDLYDHDFSPKPWTPEIVATLKHAMRLNSKQPGANHLFIHAVEASANPRQALASAEFLVAAMPEVSHLVHMPSHIYIRTGAYDKGIIVNSNAVKGYNNYVSKFTPVGENVALYLLHNVHMKLSCAQMAGNYNIAIEASEALQKEIPDFYLSIPGALGNYVQYLHQSPLLTWVRFGKWAEILKEPVADTLTFTPVLLHFARGLAFAKTNQLPLAVQELGIMKIKMEEPSLKEPLKPFNDTYSVASIAEGILGGVIAEKNNDFATAIILFQQAVTAEDNLVYNEPRDWLLPARHYLGNALLKAGKYPEAIQVFKKDLQVNPNNGWALTGLVKCYKKQGDKKALLAAKRQLAHAWTLNDTKVVASVY